MPEDEEGKVSGGVWWRKAGILHMENTGGAHRGPVFLMEVASLLRLRARGDRLVGAVGVGRPEYSIWKT